MLILCENKYGDDIIFISNFTLCGMYNILPQFQQNSWREILTASLFYINFDFLKQIIQKNLY